MERKHIARILVAIGCVLILVGLVGKRCTPRTLDSFVKEAQKKLPFDMGDGLTMVGIEITDEDLVIMAVNDEHDMRFDDKRVIKEISSFQKEYKNYFANELVKSENSIWKKLIALCIKEEKGMLWLVKGNKSGVTVTMLDLGPYELSGIYRTNQ